MERHQDIRDGVRELCSTFPPEYYRRDGYPEEFVQALTKAGWLAADIRCRDCNRWAIHGEAGIELAGRD